MTAREREQADFQYCVAVAQGRAIPATEEAAHLALLAAALLGGGRPPGIRLQMQGEAFFGARGKEPLDIQAIGRLRLVRDFARFHDGLMAALAAEGEVMPPWRSSRRRAITVIRLPLTCTAS